MMMWIVAVVEILIMYPLYNLLYNDRCQKKDCIVLICYLNVDTNRMSKQCKI